MTSFVVLLFAASGAWADPSVTRTLVEKGYDPGMLEQSGKQICQPNSSQLITSDLKSQSQAISATVKREELVRDAVGFARLYGERRTFQRHRYCDVQSDPDCTNTDALIRKLSKVGPGQDWCAAFVATLSEMVDEQAPGGAKNLLHSSKDPDDASDYASAMKLLAIFDSKTGVDSMRWPNCRKKGDSGCPKAHYDDFLSPRQRPVEGCVAIYKDRRSNQGHIALVVSVSNDGSMETVEGNTAPVSGSEVRGVFAHSFRPWGPNQTYEESGRVMEYRGCVLPWPGDSKHQDNEVCTQAKTDKRIKPLEDPFRDVTDGVQTTAKVPASSSQSGE